MGKSLRNRLLTIFAVIVASVFLIYPPSKKINLGLDLKGGMHLVLGVKTEGLDEKSKNDAILRSIEILRNRIDSLGIGETVIQRQGDQGILVQLPGIVDRDSAIKLIGQTAKLDFHLVSDNPSDFKEALEGKIPDGYTIKHTKGSDSVPLLIENEVALSGEMVSDALVDFDSTGFNQPYISLVLSGKGAKIFEELTRNNIGRRLAIILDDQVYSAPSINEVIPGGKAQITGQFTYDESVLLALALRSGALPVEMNIEEERTIGPLLGKDSIDAGITAAMIGVVLVLIFMFGYYLKAGFISGIALMVNLLLVFGIMGFLNLMLPQNPLTLTLPGIAGIILTMGMAVDANILINERIREEMNNGRPLKAAINTGFRKAFKAIVDSNTTTLIAAFMLFQFGSGPIKGFAVTLSIGLIASLFTALFLTRTLFMMFFEKQEVSSLKMLNILLNVNIDFISKRHMCFILSFIVLIGSAVILVQKKDAAYGIDFVGGQIQEYRFEKPIVVEDLRRALGKEGLEDAVIQQFSDEPENIIIRTSNNAHKESYDKVNAVFRNVFPENPFDILRIESVGPVVGKALRQAAALAVIFALGGILLYIGLRFKHFDFATAGVIALLHDVFVTVGILLVFGREIDLLVVTALLTIAGYSINDTIIIYDRIRENLVALRKKPLKDIINISINQTLGRTILTTITTLIVVVTLFLRGGDVLNTFALTLIIGFIAGTYSTIFIASPLVLVWERKTNKK